MLGSGLFKKQRRDLPVGSQIVIVKERPGDKKSRWIEVGAAWVHKDGKGFSLKLEYLPLNGGELSLRIPSDKKSETTEGGAA